MSNHKAEHNFESIKREITAIIRELKDPRLKSGFTSVVKIANSDDGSSYKIFVSSLDGLAFAKSAVDVLNSAKGFIKNELGKRLSLRYIPNLTFIPNDTTEYGVNMSKRIDELLSK